MSRYWNPLVHRLTPYVPGEQPKLPNLIKLNTNENPYPPSPRVAEAIAAELANGGDHLRLYPDPNADRLKEAIARRYAHFGVAAENVFVGNGSDEVLAHAFLALFGHQRPLLLPDITYSFYPVYCTLFGIACRTIPLDDNFAIRPEDYAIPSGGVVVANPNAPTGRLLARPALEQLLAMHAESVVLVDEAYIDFGGETAISLLARHANLLVVHTLSKSRSLAGLRVGYAIGSRELIEALARVKDSFNSYPLDRLAIAGAVAAVDDEEYFERTRQKVIASREALGQSLGSLGFTVVPSAANFVFARHPQQDAATLAAALRARGIIVRHFRQARIEQYLRITIGTDEQCRTLVQALRALVR